MGVLEWLFPVRRPSPLDSPQMVDSEWLQTLAYYAQENRLSPWACDLTNIESPWYNLTEVAMKPAVEPETKIETEETQ